MDISELSEHPELIDEMAREDLETTRAELSTAVHDLVTQSRDKERSEEDRRADLPAAKEAKERIASIDARLEVLAETDADIDAEAEALLEGLDLAEPEAEVEVPEVEAEPEPVAEITEAPEAEVAEEPELVTVAASVPSIGQLAKRAPKLPEPEPVLVANAGPMVRADHPQGLRTPLEVGKAALDIWNSHGKTSRADFKALVASFDTGSQYKYEVNGDEMHDVEVIDALLKDVRAASRQDPKTASLVASGGVCAPAQPVYDFFSIVDTSGMIQLPTVSAPRGALTYPVSPSYQSIRTSSGWNAAVANQHTNAEDISGTTKPNFHVECPTTTTCTIAAYSTILEFGNFAQKFYPEAVANSISLSAAFAAHKVNAAHILAMVAASTSVNGGATNGGGLVNVANIVGFEAAKYRDLYRMERSASLELVVPAWVEDALVADLVTRDSTTDFGNAHARVRAVFESINVNVQWVQDWQSIGDANDGGWRQAADMMLYAPGTFVRMDEGRLDLGVVRDSIVNATNSFQIFDESFEAICEIGHDSFLLDDVTICPNGATGNRVTIDCNPGYNS